jgi:hypothetical protein
VLAEFPISRQLSLEWLAASFAAAGVVGRLRGFRVEQLATGVGLVAHLERLHLDWEEDAPGDRERANFGPRSVIAKQPALSDSTRMLGVRLRMYEREAKFYERVAQLSPLATPAVFGARFDPKSHHFIIVLQELGGRFVDQTTGCTISEAESLVDAVAGHHARFWNCADVTGETWIPRLADHPYPVLVAALFARSWARADNLFAGSLNDAARIVGGALVSRLSSVMARLSEPPLTLCHGDFRVDNVCFDQNGRPWVFDWQLPDFSKGPRDLGYLLSQSVAAETMAGRHKELVARYLEALGRGGIDDYGFSEAFDDYRFAVAFSFIFPVIAAASLTHFGDRHLAVCQSAIARAAAALDELDVPALFA